jgi:Carboxypeptidase regulatory-like domain
VNFTNSASHKTTPRARDTRSSNKRDRILIWLALSILLCASPALAQSQQPPPPTGASDPQPPVEQFLGSISGTVVDPSGAAVGKAQVKLAREDQSSNKEMQADDNGQFTFENVPPGPFNLVITAEGFAPQVVSGTLHPGEVYLAPQIAMALATANTVVRVSLPPEEIAETQIKEEEKQHVLGFIPNFYVTYAPHPVPLNHKQKFELAWKTTIDPFNFAITGVVAGVEQWQNTFSGYGQGAQGYGKRYGASFTDGVTATFIGSAILPSILKQDPRYYYKGTGSFRSRFFYAIANSVICKGDNGKWQPNYSGILGSLAAGGISNLYYPSTDRNGAELTFVNAGIGIGATAAANIFQEFVVRKITPRLPNHDPANNPANP